MQTGISNLLFSKSFPSEIPVPLSYEELANVWSKLNEDNPKDFSSTQREKFRRILLLGQAFSKELNPLAEKLYNYWLLGEPASVKSSSNSMSSRSGTSFSYYNNETNSDEQRPWFRIDWAEIKSKTVEEFKTKANELGQKMISERKFSDDLNNSLKDELRNRDVGYSGAFGDITPQSLSHPEFLLFTSSYANEIFNEELKIEYWKQILKERDSGAAILLGENILPSLLVLFLNRRSILEQKMADVVSSLGSFGINAYVKGNFNVVAGSTSGKKKGIFKFTHIGLRIIDAYDFNGWQPLGCWYPEKGHDLSEVRLAMDFAESNDLPDLPFALGAFAKCTLLNNDFDEFRTNVVQKFNALSKSYKLKCMDYWLLTPMLMIGELKLPAYEIEV